MAFLEGVIDKKTYFLKKVKNIFKSMLSSCLIYSLIQYNLYSVCHLHCISSDLSICHKFGKRLCKMYSETCQTSKMEPFAKITKGFQLLTIVARSSKFVRSYVCVRQVFSYPWLGFACLDLEHIHRRFK